MFLKWKCDFVLENDFCAVQEFVNISKTQDDETIDIVIKAWDFIISLKIENDKFVIQIIV